MERLVISYQVSQYFYKMGEIFCDILKLNDESMNVDLQNKNYFQVET